LDESNREFLDFQQSPGFAGNRVSNQKLQGDALQFRHAAFPNVQVGAARIVAGNDFKMPMVEWDEVETAIVGMCV
jgi:hypothetical protein